MSHLLDDEGLLALLEGALSPAPFQPGPDELAGLHASLAARSTREPEEHSDAAVVPIGAATPRSSSRSAGLRKVRHPVTALIAAAVLATSGVAAAGVATDILPGPARHFAYVLGLPVSSPALDATRGTMAGLESALHVGDLARVRVTGAQLRYEIAGLSGADRARVEPAADHLLAEADIAMDHATGPAGGTARAGDSGAVASGAARTDGLTGTGSGTATTEPGGRDTPTGDAPGKNEVAASGSPAASPSADSKGSDTGPSGVSGGGLSGGSPGGSGSPDGSGAPDGSQSSGSGTTGGSGDSGSGPSGSSSGSGKSSNSGGSGGSGGISTPDSGASSSPH